jgi:5-methylcytosine-specific restriction endonuclease McrA
MTKRRSISKLMRVRIFDKALGLCHLCGLRIGATEGEKWHVEHLKPLWEGGKDDESNMAPAHINCHATKSKGEAPAKAKTDRQRDKHLGATRPAGQIKSRGFAKAEKPDKPPARTAPRMTNIARRFGLREN